MKKFWHIITWPIHFPFNYLRPMWEGDDGKPSYRRIAQVIFLVLIIFAVVKGQTLQQYGFYSLIVLCLAFLLLAAIITAQQIIDCVNGVDRIKNSLLPGQKQDTP